MADPKKDRNQNLVDKFDKSERPSRPGTDVGGVPAQPLSPEQAAPSRRPPSAKKRPAKRQSDAPDQGGEAAAAGVAPRPAGAFDEASVKTPLGAQETPLRPGEGAEDNEVEGAEASAASDDGASAQAEAAPAPASHHPGGQAARRRPGQTGAQAAARQSAKVATGRSREPLEAEASQEPPADGRRTGKGGKVGERSLVVLAAVGMPILATLLGAMLFLSVVAISYTGSGQPGKKTTVQKSQGGSGSGGASSGGSAGSGSGSSAGQGSGAGGAATGGSSSGSSGGSGSGGILDFLGGLFGGSGGGSSAGTGSNSGSTAPTEELVVTGDAAELAKQILRSDRITVEGNPKMSLDQAANGQCSTTGLGGCVGLDKRLLEAILKVSAKYPLTLTSFTTGCHSGCTPGGISNHYFGRAVDLGSLDRSILAEFAKYGATELLGPGDPGHSDHLHVGWGS
jgi:hypothetical protein